MRLFAGLDVSSFDMNVCVINQEGTVVDRFTVDNDYPGAAELKGRLIRLSLKENARSLKIG